MKTLFLLFLLLIAGFFSAAQQAVLLPENLAYFTASRTKGTVTLRWQTLNEQNSKGFKVQRKTAGGWELIAFLPSNAGGNSSAKVSYEHTDINGFKGVSQYQVAEVTNDYKQKTSEIKAVKGEAQDDKITVYPNPSSDGRINLVFDDPSPRDIFITDLTGRLLTQFRASTNQNFAVENLVAGFYSIRIVDLSANEIFVEKVVVTKR